MRSLFAAAVLSLPILLTGCVMHSTPTDLATQGAGIQGSVFGGQQPINLAHVYLMAANTTGYGQPSVSLLNAAATGNSDSVGAYVTTNVRGFFTITGDYTCTPGTQVYLLVLQGDAGGGNNTAAGEMGAFGQCPASGNFLSTIPFVQINEVTTVATAYALAGFGTDALHVSSSGTAAAQKGIANAFLNASNIASVVTAPNSGSLNVTPAGNGVVPARLVNTLASIIATCVNSTGPGSPNCQTLFQNALSAGITGVQPTETASALFNIAHHPTANVAALYSLTPAVAAFAPTLTAQPNDLTLALTFTARQSTFANSTAIDADGSFWKVDSTQGANGVTKLNSLGVDQTTASTFTGGTYSHPDFIAIDATGNAWVANQVTGHTNLAEFSSTGTLLSGPNGYTAGAIPSAIFETGIESGIAFDPTGNAWIQGNNQTDKGLTVLNSSGALVSPAAGYNYAGAGLALDPQGHVFIPELNQLVKLNNNGSGVPGSPFANSLFNNAASGLSLDRAGNVWLGRNGSPQIAVYSSAGAPVFSNGINDPNLSNPSQIAFDGDNAAYALNVGSGNFTRLTVSGGAVTSSALLGQGFLHQLEGDIAVDGSGDVWITDFVYNGFGNPATNPRIVEFIGAAAPVVTPLAVAVKNGTVATRP